MLTARRKYASGQEVYEHNEELEQKVRGTRGL
jgi:hypothetical protein